MSKSRPNELSDSHSNKKKKMEANAHTFFQYFVTEYMYLYFYLQVS